MNKVICDICGTTYPESADRCPICGAPRTENTQIVVPDDGAGAAGHNVKVKGGRFSSANVKKRNADGKTAGRTTDRPSGSGGTDSVNRALLIVLLVLLLAVVCVFIFIFVRFFAVNSSSDVTTAPTASSTAATESTSGGQNSQPTESLGSADIPCVSLKLQQTLYMLNTEKPSSKILVQVFPENTTDELVFHSDDPSVVAVSTDGTLTAVGSGNGTVTITCGDAIVQCVVVVELGTATEPTETVVPTTPTETQAPTDPTEESTEPSAPAFTLDTYDVTMFFEGESFTFGTGKIPRTSITWSSDNPDVAVVENGRVTAKGTGITIIRAQYGGQERECIIRALWLELDTSSLTLTSKGETKKIDEKSVIYSTQVKWSTDNPAVATVQDGVVTAVGEGTATISGMYRDVVVSCTVTCAWATEPAPSESTGTTEPSSPTESTAPSTEPPTEPTETEATTETGTTGPTE